MECSSAKLIPKDSVVMAMYGATASQVCYLKNEMTTNQACCNMICDSKSKACFLYFHLKAIQSDIKSVKDDDNFYYDELKGLISAVLSEITKKL